MGRAVDTARSLMPSLLLRLRVGELEGGVFREASDFYYFLYCILLLLLLTEVLEI